MPTATINPQTYLVRSYRQQDTTVVQALGEFLDNAFGKHRGNARRACILFDQKAKRLEFWDNGRGIADPSRMFILGTRPDEGDLSDITVDDPGRWGVGGTSSALALGSQMEVHTIHKGRYAKVAIDWDVVAETENFPVIEWEWVDPSKAASPVLRRIGGGGMLLVVKGVDKFPPGKTGGYFPAIKDDLSEIYSPALASGREIIWFQRYESRKDKAEVLKAKLPDVTFTVKKTLKIDGTTGVLPVRLEAGYNPDLPSTKSGTDVIFGIRRLTQTREPFRGEMGVGVYVRLELGAAWKQHMYTLKSGIRSQREWSMLMDRVHEAIKPLLDKSASDRRSLRIAALSTKLKVELEERLAVIKASPAEEDEDDPTITPVLDDNGEGEGDGVIKVHEPLKQDDNGNKARQEGDEGKKKREPRGLPVEFTFVKEENLPGLMARATVDVDTAGRPLVNVQVNEDHPYVSLAIDADKMGGHPVLNYIVLSEAVRALAERDDILLRLLPAKLFDIGQAPVADRARMLEGMIMREEAK